VSRCGVDLVLLEGMNIWSQDTGWSSLRSCRNLVSSTDTTGFKGHFEFRIKALVSEKG